MQVQLVFTLLLVALSWFLAEDLEEWTFFRWWTAGWFALAAQLLVSRVGLHLPTMTWLERVAFATLPILGMSEVACFAIGAGELLRRRRVGVAIGFGGLVLASVAGLVIGLSSLRFWPTSSLAVALQTTPRSAGLAVIFPISALAFYRMYRERLGVAEHLVIVGFVLYGLDQGVYAWGGVRDLLSLASGGNGAPGLNALTLLSAGAVRADLAWEALLGIGSVLLLRREGRSVRRALRQSEARYRTLFEHSLDGILLIDDGGRVSDANASALDLLGRSQSDVIGTPFGALTESGDADAVARVATTPRRTLEVEGTMRRSDGTGFPVELSLSSFEHAGRTMTEVLVRDVTTRKRLEASLSHRANHHPLTDLPNRFWFRKEFEKARARVLRSGSRVGILFVDLDGFKEVNDTLGHAAGDAVLIEVGSRLSAAIRLGDAVAHVGGDEFTVLLHDCLTANQLREAGQRLLDVVEIPIQLGEQEVRLSASVGGTLSGSAEEYERILLRADQAMYSAKRNGGARIVVDVPEA